MLREGAVLCLPLCAVGPSTSSTPLTQRGPEEEEGTAGRAASPAADGLLSQPLSWDNVLCVVKHFRFGFILNCFLSDELNIGPLGYANL